MRAERHHTRVNRGGTPRHGSHERPSARDTQTKRAPIEATQILVRVHASAHAAAAQLHTQQRTGTLPTPQLRPLAHAGAVNIAAELTPSSKSIASNTPQLTVRRAAPGRLACPSPPAGSGASLPLSSTPQPLLSLKEKEKSTNSPNRGTSQKRTQPVVGDRTVRGVGRTWWRTHTSLVPTCPRRRRRSLARAIVLASKPCQSAGWPSFGSA